MITSMKGKQMYVRIRKDGLRTNVEFSSDNVRFYTPDTFFDMKSSDYSISIDTGIIDGFVRVDSFVINTKSPEIANNG
jgi:hypothetical protein